VGLVSKYLYGNAGQTNAGVSEDNVDFSATDWVTIDHGKKIIWISPGNDSEDSD